MRTLVGWTLALTALSFATPAMAGCDQPYTTDNLLQDLIAVEFALRDGNDAFAGENAVKMEAGLACLPEVLPTQIAGRSLRAIGAGLLASGNAEKGQKWLVTAAEVEQTFDYGLEDLPEQHPVREAWSQAKESASGMESKVSGKQLKADSKHYLDGRPIDLPTARTERFHIYQRQADAVESFVIDGNGFPEAALEDKVLVTTVAGKEEKVKAKVKLKEEKVAKKDKKKDSATASAYGSSSSYGGGGSTVMIDRQRPPEKTPLMIAGGAVLAGAGGVYYGSMSMRKKFDESNNESEVRDLQPKVNQLVIASAAVAAVGAGTLTWGIILDGGTPLPGIHVRF